MEQEIQFIKGVGSKTKSILNENKIFTTNDLLLNYPSKYLFFTEYQTLSLINHNEIVSVFIKVNSPLEINEFSKTKVIKFNALFNDKEIKITAFNQLYLSNIIKENETIFITGKYNYYKNEIILNKVLNYDNFSEIKAVYNIDGISDYNISKIVENIFETKAYKINEKLPEKIIYKYSLLSRVKTLRELHLPSSKEMLNSAIKRIKYEEAYNFMRQMNKRVNIKFKINPKNYDISKVKKLIEKLPFELTNDQKNTVNDIYKDFKLDHTTYRLIQGDVGAGKTVVAMLAIYGILTANEQVVLMAPTEILAKQHFDLNSKYFDAEYESVLLTGSTKNKDKIKKEIKSGKIRFIVGTHALITDDVEFKNLGLVIIDEQHKFGVNTRNKLIKKGFAHVLYLTATPIPRTLAISIFGDAKISLIKEKPKNRLRIETKYLSDKNIKEAILKLKETISKNEKAYIVVPAIESDHARYNVSNTYEIIKKYLPEYNNIYKLHGKFTKEEQEQIINKFISDDSAILVSTSMIEVGIDVKNATLIIIFAANFFGLSQLHQLRGRVGRSNLKSYCYLISDSLDSERLSIIEKNDDGFLLSEYDLKLRGPGAFLGLEQAGHFKFKHLDLINDYEILINIKRDMV